MSHASQKEADRIMRAMEAIVNPVLRLPELFAVAVPGAVGLLCLYGVYDSVRMHQYRQGVWALALAMIFTGPLVLLVLSERRHRAFARWLEINRAPIAVGTIDYEGMRVSGQTEVVWFDVAFSVVVGSFKIRTPVLVVGRDGLWPWRVGCTLLSFVFGWWNVPDGVINTFQALDDNVKAAHRCRLIDLLGIPKKFQ